MNAVVSGQMTGAAQPRKKWVLWTGRVLSALPVVMMLLSGVAKLAHAPQVVENMTGKFGYPEGTITPIGLIEVACAVVYAIPRTSVLGAVLVAGYFGGAVATHVRIGDPSFIAPLLLGIFAWLGLYLRDNRLHALVPLRSSPS
jgi:hypothetical protein